MMVMNLILLRFEEGQNVTLTFPSEINIDLSQINMSGGQTNVKKVHIHNEW